MMKGIILLVIACMLVSGAFACPPEQIFKQDLKKGLFSYLSNPGQSVLTLSELKDLITVYLSTEDISTLDCSTIVGNESGIVMSDILSKTEQVALSVIPVCSDSTYYGECSTTKPKFCYSGMLKYMCYGPDRIVGNEDDCGCPEDYDVCEDDGSCRTPVISCFSDADCGASTYYGSTFCISNDVYRHYINFTCSNSGTGEASCSYENQSVLIQECSHGCTDGSCR